MLKQCKGRKMSKKNQFEEVWDELQSKKQVFEDTNSENI